MKVVLFCGGLGMRLRDYSEDIPKPMVTIGYRPILWHLMKYYAHFGHRDFILCLGYKADYIKNYFLEYEECLSNDFVMSRGGRSIELLGTDIEDWKITFVDTGFSSNIGERLKAVQPHLENEEFFLANYSDNLTDFHLPDLVETFRRSTMTAGLLCVQPAHTFHIVHVDDQDCVTRVEEARGSGMWINGGYFIFRREIFDHLHDGEELVQEPFYRLIQLKKLLGYRYRGFWQCMDTFKDKHQLAEMYGSGHAPWEVWKRMTGSPQSPRDQGTMRVDKPRRDSGGAV